MNTGELCNADFVLYETRQWLAAICTDREYLLLLLLLNTRTWALFSIERWCSYSISIMHIYKILKY